MMKMFSLNAYAFLCLSISTYAETNLLKAGASEMQQEASKEISLREALTRISQEFGVKFTYERTVVDKIKVRYNWDSINYKIPQAAIEKILAGSGLNLKVVKDNHFIITRPGSSFTSLESSDEPYRRNIVQLTLKGDTILKPGLPGKQLVSLTGTVSEKGSLKPVEGATITIVQYGLFAISDSKGSFSFKQVPDGKATLQIQFVSMVTLYKELNLEEGKTNYLSAELEANALNMKDILVVATENRTGATSSNISRKAIEHLQATSLADVMQLLPGSITTNPDFSNVNRFAIRQVSKASDVSSNLGTALIMNGAPVSNNGNMQSMSTSTTGGLASFSTSTGGGVDLRSITADNIESVEVIRGIPSVEYGDLTSGAIIVKTKAGAEPFNIKARINPKLTQFWMGKGFALGPKKGDLNVDLDYTKAMNDQRSRNNSYNRITGNILYSRKLFTERPLYTTTGFTYGMNLDDEKLDPDDKREQRRTKAQNYSFRFNTSGKWSLQKKFARTINYNVTLDYSIQKSYQQALNSGDIYPLSYQLKDTLAPGQFVPSEYISQVWVDGKPLNIFSKITNTFFAKTGSFNHRVIMGTEWRMDVNNGKGRTFDSNRPPRQFSGNGFRARTLSDIPAVNLFSAYLEDNIYTYISGRKLSLQAGLRLDNVTKAGSALSPRSNLSFEISKDLSFHAGIGLTSKAPTLLYLYPDNAYYDLISFNYYSAVPAERLLMVSTRVFNTENPDIKYSQNLKKEIGFDLNIGQGKRLTVTAFYERVKNDFLFTKTINSTRMVPFSVLDTINTRPGQTPVLNPAPKQIDTFVADYSMPTNNNLRVNKGIEFDLDLGRFEAIRTSFVFNGAWISSTNKNEDYVIRKRQISGRDPNKIGIFAKGSDDEHEENQRISTTLRLIHHIPELRFIVTFSAQTIWMEQNKNLGLDSLAIGYIRKNNSQVVWLSKAERDQIVTNNDLELRSNINTDLYKTETWKPLWMYNLRLTKEIGKNVGFSFFANNVFMHRPLEASTRNKNLFTQRNQVFFFGTELNFKF